MSEDVLYLSAKHDVVPKDVARWKVINKYDDKGELIEEVWMDLQAEES